MLVTTFRNGLSSLLRPEDSVLVLIDHQPFQIANLNSHDPQMVITGIAFLWEQQLLNTPVPTNAVR